MQHSGLRDGPQLESEICQLELFARADGCVIAAVRQECTVYDPRCGKISDFQGRKRAGHQKCVPPADPRVHSPLCGFQEFSDFPMDDTHMFFEDFIMQVGRCVEIAESTEMASREINALLYQNLNTGEKKARIHRIFRFSMTSMRSLALTPSIPLLLRTIRRRRRQR